LTAVAAHYNDLDYDGGPQADYVDIVIVARLQSLLGSDHPDAARDWGSIKSFDKIGLAAEIEVVQLEGAEDEINDVSALFLH
jgi:hypothetical protein